MWKPAHSAPKYTAGRPEDNRDTLPDNSSTQEATSHFWCRKAKHRIVNSYLWFRQLRGRFISHTQEGSIYTKFEADCWMRSNVIKVVPNFWNKVTWPRPRPLRGRFMIRTKFQADSTFRPKVINGSRNFEIGSHDPGQAQLWVALYSVRRGGPSSICIPNLKRIALFVQKLFRVPKFGN